MVALAAVVNQTCLVTAVLDPKARIIDVQILQHNVIWTIQVHSCTGQQILQIPFEVEIDVVL